MAQTSVITSPPDQPCRRARLFWLAVVQLLGLAGVGIWLAMPGGFPIDHWRFLAPATGA